MNYPNGIKKHIKETPNYGNRGMTLEEDINISNDYYRDNDIAIIYKKPTPITVNKVDFRSRCDATITEAHYLTPSTTDYNGVYKGFYIDFEAKETISKTSFPLANIHAHQIEHLKRITKHGGIGFIVVSFTKLNRIFILMANDLIAFIVNNDRKSIPLEYFITNGQEIPISLRPRIDYLKYISFERKENGNDTKEEKRK